MIERTDGLDQGPASAPDQTMDESITEVGERQGLHLGYQH